MQSAVALYINLCIFKNLLLKMSLSCGYHTDIPLLCPVKQRSPDGFSAALEKCLQPFPGQDAVPCDATLGDRVRTCWSHTGLVTMAVGNASSHYAVTGAQDRLLLPAAVCILLQILPDTLFLCCD